MDSIMDMLNQFSNKEQDAWLAKNTKKPFLKNLKATTDTTLRDRMNSFKAILNEDLEFQINDSIMWYNNNYVYFLATTKTAKEDLDKLKQNPKALQPFMKYEITSTSLLPTSRINLVSHKNGYYDDRAVTIATGTVKLSSADIARYEKIVPAPVTKPGEVYEGHRVEMSLFCEKRYNGSFLQDEKRGEHTHNIFIRFNMYKRIKSGRLFINYPIESSLRLSGYAAFTADIQFTVERVPQSAWAPSTPPYRVNTCQVSIDVEDLMDIKGGNEIPIYNTSWVYRENFKSSTSDFDITLYTDIIAKKKGVEAAVVLLEDYIVFEK